MCRPSDDESDYVLPRTTTKFRKRGFCYFGPVAATFRKRHKTNEYYAEWSCLSVTTVRCSAHGRYVNDDLKINIFFTVNSNSGPDLAGGGPGAPLTWGH